MEARTLTFTTLIVANLGLILTNRSWSRTILATFRSPNAALGWVMGGAGHFPRAGALPSLFCVSFFILTPYIPTISCFASLPAYSASSGLKCSRSSGCGPGQIPANQFRNTDYENKMTRREIQAFSPCPRVSLPAFLIGPHFTFRTRWRGFPWRAPQKISLDLIFKKE